MVIKDETELLNAFFTSVSNRKTRCPLGFHPSELEDKDREQNKLPIIQEEVVSGQLCYSDTPKFFGLDGPHPRALRKLAEELSKPLSIIYQQSWLAREVPGDWRLASVKPIYKKGWKEI